MFSRPPKRAALGAGSIVLFLLVVSIVVPLINRARRPHYDGRTPSGDRLHQVGLAILLYTSDKHGAYPSTLVQVLAAEGMPLELARCPPRGGSDEEEPPYVYLGRGMTDATATQTTVVAYEPLSYNDGVGTDVLFGDGHTEYLEAAALRDVLSRGRKATRPATGRAR